MPNPNLPAPYKKPGGLIARREDRALEKQFRGLEASTSLELARVDGVALIEARKIEALETTGHIGLASAASLAEHRRFRVEHEPEDAAIYDYIAERSIRAIGDRIEGLNRRLG
jgi:hypothetical protein